MKNKVMKPILKVEKTKDLPRYEDNYKLRELKVLFVIVGRGQADYYINQFEEIGVSATYVTYGQGTVRKDLQHILGLTNPKKDVLLCLVTKTKLDGCIDVLNERFKVSKEAKGVAFTVELDSMIGVLSYKFFTDTKQNRRK